MDASWLEVLRENAKAETANTFVLHGNVSDDVMLGEELLRFYEVVPKMEPFNQASVIAFFNLATGVRFGSLRMKQVFLNHKFFQ